MDERDPIRETPPPDPNRIRENPPASTPPPWPAEKSPSSPRRWSVSLSFVVIVIVLVTLFGFGSVGVMQVRESAHRSMSQNNLKQIGIGIHTVTGAYEGKAPPSVGRFPSEGGYNSTFWVHIIPYVESNTLYRDATRGLSPGADIPPVREHFLVYTAPGDPTAIRTEPLLSFATNLAVFTRETANYLERLQGKGLANTIIVAEHYSVVGGERNEYWDRADFATYISGPTSGVQFDVSPMSANRDAAHAFSGGFCQVLKGDGSGGAIRESGLRAFQRACDPNVGGGP